MLALAQARKLVHATFALTVMLVPVGPAWADRDDEGDDGQEGYAIGLWGDLPYSTVQSSAGVPNLIADMNAHALKFTVHDGDLKQGSGSPGALGDDPDLSCRACHPMARATSLQASGLSGAGPESGPVRRVCTRTP